MSTNAPMNEEAGGPAQLVSAREKVERVVAT